MKYHIKRNDKEYGPYGLVDLQRYVREGSISPDDVARSEGMVDWVPVSHIVGDIAVPPQAPPRSVVGAATEPDTVVLESPGWHSLHWALVLLLTFVTCGFFAAIWMFVQAIWARKAAPDNKAPILYAAYIGLYVGGMVMMSQAKAGMEAVGALGGVVCFGALVCVVWGHFEIKNAIEDYYAQVGTHGRQLSGVMTFFFNLLYFQYHLNEIASVRKNLSGGLGLS